MIAFHKTPDRPNKVKAIASGIAAGFTNGCFRGNFEKGIAYHTLGGIRFNDLKLFYNVFDDCIRTAVSYEEDPKYFQRALKAAQRMSAHGHIGGVPLRVLPEDILESDLRVVPREGLGLILFLDLTEVLTLEHESAFRRWVFGHSLLPGDVIFVTSSLPPWELIREDFRSEVEPILRGHGATLEQLANKRYWKERYIPVLLEHFAERWRCQQLSRRGFRHFYGAIYRDTKIEMALNTFEVV